MKKLATLVLFVALAVPVFAGEIENGAPIAPPPTITCVIQFAMSLIH